MAAEPMVAETKVETKYVLSLCGGGVRDAIPATILNRLQADRGKGAADLFDMVVGVSGGAMMALHTAVQKVVHQSAVVDYMEMFSRKNLAKVMDKSPLDRVMGEVQFSPVYDGTGKTALLKKSMGNVKMAALAAVPVVVPVYNLLRRRAEIFTTYDAQYGEFMAWQVGDASSAAIPYFPPVRMSNGDWYVDGGFSCNDPILVAYTEARRHFGPDCNVRIMSLGAGTQQTDPEWSSDRIANWGAIQWMCNGLMDLIMDAPHDLMRQQVARLIQLENADSSRPNRSNRLLHINEDIPSVKLDDCDQVEGVLVAAGTRAFERCRGDIADFFDQ